MVSVGDRVKIKAGHRCSGKTGTVVPLKTMAQMGHLVQFGDGSIAFAHSEQLEAATLSAITHTPGPWEVANHGYNVNARPGAVNALGHYTSDGTAWGIASCAFEKLSNAECRANARLIAAAPDLLAALKDLLWMADAEPTSKEDVEWGKKAIAAANAAIAKANGESAT